MSGVVGTLLGGGGSRRGGARVYRPRVEVKLIKMVKRGRNGAAQRYNDAVREIDLTPYLGDGGSVQTVKALTEAEGSFAITFSDKKHPQTSDTVAAMVEPMDGIEIRASREPHRYASQRLPLIMRGWVSHVRRSTGIEQDGTPQRRVVIQGQDAGKLWLIHQVFFEVGYVTDVPFLDLFQMQAQTGIDVAYLPVGEFIRQLTERVVNPKVAKINAFSSNQFRPFRVDATVRQGLASVTNSAGVQGPYWQIAELFADRPWNELFIEDEEEGPVVRFRPAPYKNLDGELIMPNATDPGTVEVRDDAIVSLNVQRSDRQVANFFWVPPGGSMLDTSAMVSAASLQRGDTIDFDGPNNARDLYGTRRMQMPTRLLPSDLSELLSRDEVEGRRQEGARNVVLWHQRRTAELKAMNRDNGVLESGEATVRGSEELKVGRYMRVLHEDFAWDAYMARIAHNIAPFRGWTTDVRLDRGTAFLERTRRQDSAHFVEGGRGPYSPR